MDFSFTIEDNDQYKLINLYGNLSFSVCDVFERNVKELTKKNSVILNMESLNIITSSGMNSLINISLDAKTNGKRVMLLKPRKTFVEMVTAIKNYEYFIMIETVDEGKRKIKYYT